MVYLTLHNHFLLSCTWGMHMLPGTQVKTKIHKCFVNPLSKNYLTFVFYLKIYYFPLWFLWIVPCGYVRQRQGKKQRYFPSCYSMGHNSLHAGVSLRTTSTDHFKTFNKLNRNKWILGKKIKNVLFSGMNQNLVHQTSMCGYQSKGPGW